MAKQPLDFMEQQFLFEYINNGGKCAAAARACGMPEQRAYDLKKTVRFQEEYERITGDVVGRAELSADRIINELMTIAFLDPADFMNTDGTLKPLASIPPNVRRAIGSLEVTEIDGEDYIKVKTKAKAYDKMRALELLGKTTGIKMFVEKVETEGKDDIARKANMELEERLALMEKDRASVVKED